MEGRGSSWTRPYLARVSVPIDTSACLWPDVNICSKAATDKAYDDSVKTIISTLRAQLDSSTPESALHVVFGTHNQESCDLIVDRLKAEGLAIPGEDLGVRLRPDVEGKVFVAQLYGKSHSGSFRG